MYALKLSYYITSPYKEKKTLNQAEQYSNQYYSVQILNSA